MNDTQLRCFLSLSNTASFSKTADDLFISHSAVTKNIKNLENELGVELFSRRYHQVSLTSAGKFFYQGTSQKYDQMQQIIQKTKEIANRYHVLKIGCTEVSFEQEWLPLFIKHFSKKNSIQIKIDTIDKFDLNYLQESLLHQHEDLIIFQNDFFENNPKIKFIPLLNMGFSLILPKNKAHSKVTKNTFKNKDVYVWSPTSDSLKLDQVVFELQKIIDASHLHLIANPLIISTYVRAGLGIGVTPSALYDPNSSDLCYLPFAPEIVAPYGVAIAKANPKNKQLEAAIADMNYYVQMVKRNW